MKKIVHFFDKLEDNVRGHLSRYPIAYALLGGIGVVLFWRGVWHTADELPFISNSYVSLLIGTTILLATGVFVSAFVGTKLILTGLRGEKKLSEKTQDEIAEEESEIQSLEREMKHIEHKIEDIQKQVHHYHTKS